MRPGELTPAPVGEVSWSEQANPYRWCEVMENFRVLAAGKSAIAQKNVRVKIYDLAQSNKRVGIDTLVEGKANFRFRPPHAQFDSEQEIRAFILSNADRR